MIIFLDDTKALSKRFNMMEAYLTRRALNSMQAIMASTYAGNLQRGEVSFNNYLIRTMTRHDRLSKFNNAARQRLFELGFDYDLENIVIPDLSTDNRTVTFSHAQLIVFFSTLRLYNF